MAIPQQNHAKSIHFLILQVDWLRIRRRVFLWSVVRRWSTQDRRANTIFFHPGCVGWNPPCCCSNCEPRHGFSGGVALMRKSWKKPNGSDGKSRIESGDRRFFHIHQSEDGCFLLSTTSIFFYGTRVEATKHAIAQIGGWSIRSDCGMDMDMATRWSKHVTVASTKEEVVFQASIFQVLFSSSLVTQL